MVVPAGCIIIMFMLYTGIMILVSFLDGLNRRNEQEKRIERLENYFKNREK